MKRIACVLALACSLGSDALGQPHLLWAEKYNGRTSGWDEATHMALDHDGNVIVTGITSNHPFSGDFDITTLKYTTDGDTTWAATYNGALNASDQPAGIAVDDTNGVYVVGSSGSPGSSRAVILKYSADGILEWSRAWGNGALPMASSAVAIHGSSVFATANGGVVNGEDIYVFAYDGEGDTLWTRRYNGPANGGDMARSLVVDTNGDLYIAGETSEYGGFSYTDFLLLKYAATGTLLWARTYQGPAQAFDFATSVATDEQNNAYVAGLSEADHGGGPEGDYAVLMYSAIGDSQWVARYDGGYGGEYPVDIAVDSQHRVCVTGWSISAANTKSAATVRFGSDGILEWASRYDGMGYYFNEPSSLAIHPTGTLLVAGHVAVSNMANDWILIAIDPAAGDTLWTAAYDGSATLTDWDTPSQILLDEQGRAYVCGFTAETGADWDYTLLKYDVSLFLPIDLACTTEGGQIALTWACPATTAAYWVFGDAQMPWFSPDTGPGFVNRLAVVLPPETTWSTTAGAGDPTDNWTYLVMAVDTSDLPFGTSGRAGEFDTAIEMP